MWTGLDSLPWSCSPTQALARWPGSQRVLMLHSGRPHPRWSRWSLLAEPVASLRFEGNAAGEGRTCWQGTLPCPVALTHKPFADWRAVLTALPGLWIGYVSYDIRLWVEPVLRRGRQALAWPVYEWSYCPRYVVHDALRGTWHAQGTPPRLDDHEPPPDGIKVRFQPVRDRHAYEACVEQVRRYIAAGDVFQVNLAQRLTASLPEVDMAAMRVTYAQLAGVSPAWYGAYLELDDPDAARRRALLCTSPELFLELDDAGRVITRPIKGTLPATRDPQELRDSEKDAAELAMIVDLLRNDLGRVCAYGSVRVEEPRVIETHPTIHHGVATVSGQLHHSCDLFDLLRATLPGGSITGAPKVRAMQVIDELEPSPRGPYCGAIGWIRTGAEGGARAGLNVAIRTLLADPAARRLDLWVGGGIVADSTPDQEYDETLSKAAAITAALRPAVADVADQPFAPSP